MKIERPEIESTYVTGLEAEFSLDPIHIYCCNFKPGVGRITIACWDQSWTSHWNSMGDGTVQEFFCTVDDNYLINNLLVRGTNKRRDAQRYEYLQRIVRAVKTILAKAGV